MISVGGVEVAGSRQGTGSVVMRTIDSHRPSQLFVGRSRETVLKFMQGLCSKDRPGQHSILSILGIIFD